MLPRAFLQSKRDGTRLAPSWLEPKHDAWLETMIDALAMCEGMPSAEADARAETLSADARKRGISATGVAGVWHLAKPPAANGGSDDGSQCPRA